MKFIDLIRSARWNVRLSDTEEEAIKEFRKKHSNNTSEKEVFLAFKAAKTLDKYD